MDDGLTSMSADDFYVNGTYGFIRDGGGDNMYLTFIGTGLTVTGNITNPGVSVAQTLAGVIAANPTPTITATLQIVYDIQGGPNPTVTGNDTGATVSAAPGSTQLDVTGQFTTTANLPAGYTWTSGPTVTPPAYIIYGSQTVVTTITGTLQLT